MQMVMTPDETQIQILANWPMSHAKQAAFSFAVLCIIMFCWIAWWFETKENYKVFDWLDGRPDGRGAQLSCQRTINIVWGWKTTTTESTEYCCSRREWMCRTSTALNNGRAAGVSFRLWPQLPKCCWSIGKRRVQSMDPWYLDPLRGPGPSKYGPCP